MCSLLLDIITVLCYNDDMKIYGAAELKGLYRSPLSKEFFKMKMNKILAAMAATAISATAFAAMSISSASAADALGTAYMIGMIGSEQRWDAAAQEAAGSTLATVDGNAQYEVTWKVPEGGGTDTVQFLAVCIYPADGVDNFATATFPNLTATIDEVWIDGVKIDYTCSSTSVDTNYFEGQPGVTRLYLRDEWTGQAGHEDLAQKTDITSEVKVRFTVGGLDVDGTSNVTTDTEDTTEGSTDSTTTTTTAGSSDDSSTTTTTAASGDSSTTTTTAKDSSKKDSKTTTKAADGTVASASTGDLGAGAAVTALAVAGVAAFVARKKD